jgi:hypothetical protein
MYIGQDVNPRVASSIVARREHSGVFLGNSAAVVDQRGKLEFASGSVMPKSPGFWAFVANW